MSKCQSGASLKEDQSGASRMSQCLKGDQSGGARLKSGIWRKQFGGVWRCLEGAGLEAGQEGASLDKDSSNVPHMESGNTGNAAPGLNSVQHPCTILAQLAPSKNNQLFASCRSLPYVLEFQCPVSGYERSPRSPLQSSV